MPSRSVVLAAVGAAFLAGVLVWVYPHDGPHLLVEFAGISLSTFVGAYGAFQLQIRREDAKTLAERAAALRRAQFALVAQSNVLETLRQELAPLRENESRDLRLKALVFFQAIPAIDLTSIEFLLETADPDLPNVLLDCQNKWNSVIGILEQRTRDYRRYLERLAAVRGNELVGKEVTGDELRKDVGPEISGALKTLTDALYEAVDAAREANDASWARLAIQFANQFPGQRVLKRSFDPDVIKRAPGT